MNKITFVAPAPAPPAQRIIHLNRKKNLKSNGNFSLGCLLGFMGGVGFVFLVQYISIIIQGGM